MASALLVVTLLAAVTGADTLATPGWARLADRPTEADLDCASYDHHHQWSVALRDSEAVVALAERHVERQDPLPFAVPKHHDRPGERHVLPTSDGWLVGFDAGEFGGGLWFTATGEDWRRIRPGAGAPAHPEDPFKAENVHGLVVVGEQPMVLMGLDHARR